MKSLFSKINKFLITDTKREIEDSIRQSRLELKAPVLFLSSFIMYAYLSGPVLQHYKNRKYILNKEKEYYDNNEK